MYIYILYIYIYIYVYIYRERTTIIWVCLPIWDFPSVMALFGVPDFPLGCSWKDHGMTSSRLNSMVVLQGHWACNVFLDSDTFFCGCSELLFIDDWFGLYFPILLGYIGIIG